MTTRADRAAAAANAAANKLAKLQAQQARLAAELKRQRKIESDRTRALKDAERLELGRLVQEAGLNAEQLAQLLEIKGLVQGAPVAAPASQPPEAPAAEAELAGAAVAEPPPATFAPQRWH